MLKIIKLASLFGTLGCGIMVFDDYREINKSYWNSHNNSELKSLLFMDHNYVWTIDRSEKTRLEIIEDIIQNRNEKTVLQMLKHRRNDINPDIFLSIPYALQQKTVNMNDVSKICYSYLLHQNELKMYMRLKFSRLEHLRIEWLERAKLKILY